MGPIFSARDDGPPSVCLCRRLGGHRGKERGPAVSQPSFLFWMHLRSSGGHWQTRSSIPAPGRCGASPARQFMASRGGRAWLACLADPTNHPNQLAAGRRGALEALWPCGWSDTAVRPLASLFRSRQCQGAREQKTCRLGVDTNQTSAAVSIDLPKWHPASLLPCLPASGAAPLPKGKIPHRGRWRAASNLPNPQIDVSWRRELVSVPSQWNVWESSVTALADAVLPHYQSVGTGNHPGGPPWSAATQCLSLFTPNPLRRLLGVAQFPPFGQL
jgi:hypothetical protein